MYQVHCSGDEDNLISCTHTIRQYCSWPYRYGGVECAGDECFDGEVRLAKGLSETKGLVEVCLDGEWSSVCGSTWDDNDARVICRRLGQKWTGKKRIFDDCHSKLFPTFYNIAMLI